MMATIPRIVPAPLNPQKVFIPYTANQMIRPIVEIDIN